MFGKNIELLHRYGARECCKNYSASTCAFRKELSDCTRKDRNGNIHLITFPDVCTLKKGNKNASIKSVNIGK